VTKAFAFENLSHSKMNAQRLVGGSSAAAVTHILPDESSTFENA